MLTEAVQLRKAATEKAIHRFRSVRRLTPNPTAEWVKFQIDVSLRSLLGTAEMDRASSLAPDRAPSSTRQAPVELPGGTSASGDVMTSARLSLKTVLKSLHNASNLCYLNTCLLCLAWAVLQAELRTQVNIHALTQSVPLISIQLLRFHEDDNDVVQRDERHLVGHSGASLLPVFCDNLG